MQQIIYHDYSFLIVEQSKNLATLFEVFINNDKELYLQKRFNYNPSQYNYLTKGSNNFVFINKDQNTVFKVPTYEGITENQKKTKSKTIVNKWNQIHTNKLGKAASVINNDFFISSNNQTKLEKSDIKKFIDPKTDKPFIFSGKVKFALNNEEEINYTANANSVASFPFLKDLNYSKLFMDHFNLSHQKYKALESRSLISYKNIYNADKETDTLNALNIKYVLKENFENYNLNEIQLFELSVNRAIKAECLRIYIETGLIIYDAYFNNFLFRRESNGELKAICIDVDFALNYDERLVEKKEKNELEFLKIQSGRDATGIANILKYIDDRINSDSYFGGILKLDHLSHKAIKVAIVEDETIEKKIFEANRSMLKPEDLGEFFERLEEGNPILKMQAMLKSYLTQRTTKYKFGILNKFGLFISEWSMKTKKIEVLKNLYERLGDFNDKNWDEIKETIQICKSSDQKLNWRNKKSENQKMLQECLDIVEKQMPKNSSLKK